MRSLILCALCGVGQLLVPAVGAQPAKLESCSIDRPWTATSGELLSPKGASAAYQGLDNRWSVDSGATIREISALLSANPRILGLVSAAADGCPKGGCACPKPPKLAQTAQTAQSASLVAGFRADPDGTAAATAIFLSTHSWLVNRLRDSLLRSGSKDQVTALNTGLRNVKAAPRPPNN